MFGFLQDYLLFIIIILVVIAIIIIVYYLFVRTSRVETKDEKVNDKVSSKISNAISKASQLKSEENFEDDFEEDFEEEDSKITKAIMPEEDIEEKKAELQSDEEIIAQSSVIQKEESVEPEKIVDEKEVNQDKPSSDQEEQGKYHVMYRSKDSKWYVKREGSEKVLKLLHTKKEAIAYATIKAIKQDTNIVIHSKDGKIEKHGY